VPERTAVLGGERGALRQIFASDAKYGFLMVFLGACVFSTMMNFQTTYAETSGLDFSVFYICYTAAVIGSRFLISGVVNRREPMRMTILLLALMCGALVMFQFIGQSTLVYGAASVVLGVSYGLVYPLIQAQTVNAVREQLRSRTLVYFSLAYFLAVFGFPLLGGRVIVEAGYASLLVLLTGAAALELAVAVWRWMAARERVCSVGSQ